MSAKKIMIVEDERIVAEDIVQSLQSMGYEIPAIISAGEEAVLRAHQTNPDLVLMDITLKGEMDGIRAAEFIRRDLDIPVVYLTAYADGPTLERAKATAPFGYILKPFEVKELQTAIEIAIQRHAIEQQLKVTKQWFENTLQCMGHGVIVTNDCGEITHINPIAELMTGWKKEAAHGQALEKIFHCISETREDLGNPIQKAMSNPSGAAQSAFLITPDNREIPIVAKVTPIRDGNEHFTGFVVAFLDISERKRLEKLKDEFVSTVSHEMRTPLMIIRESIAQVMDGIHGDVNDKQKNFLMLSLRGVDRLGRIINDLLDMSKIEAGEVEFKRDQVDLVELIHEIYETFQSMARIKGIEIRLTLPEKKMEIYADRGRIMQIFANLMGNCLKFTEHGYIEIHVKDSEKSVECTISDTGIGIAEEDLSKTFQKFQQFSRESGPGQKGTGLGLAICKGLVELHHGQISVESKVGEGTRFTFTLPKYSFKEIFKEYLKRFLADAAPRKAPFSMLELHFENLDQVYEKIGRVKSAYVMQRLKDLIGKQSCRRADIVLKEKEYFIILLPGTSREGADEAHQRMTDVAKRYFTRLKLNKLVRVSSQVLSYPDEMASDEDFLKAAGGGKWI